MTQIEKKTFVEKNIQASLYVRGPYVPCFKEARRGHAARAYTSANTSTYTSDVRPLK